jgi:hypothetical protein
MPARSASHLPLLLDQAEWMQLRKPHIEIHLESLYEQTIRGQDWNAASILSAASASIPRTVTSSMAFPLRGCCAAAALNWRNAGPTQTAGSAKRWRGFSFARLLLNFFLRYDPARQDRAKKSCNDPYPSCTTPVTTI